MREFDSLAMSAKNDPTLMEELIRKNEWLILKNASKVTNRYITKSDDEWSIALHAFSQAIESYELEKGNFLTFSELVIKRRLIDYIRSQGKYSSELSIDPVLFDTEPEDEEENIGIKAAVAAQVSKQESSNLKLEIEAANLVFREYGFSFFDLTSCSPQAKKTRAACAKAVNYMRNNPILITDMRNSGLLPVKIIEKNIITFVKINEQITN